MNTLDVSRTFVWYLLCLTYQNIAYTLDRVGNVREYTNDAASYKISQRYEYDKNGNLTKERCGQREARELMNGAVRGTKLK